ncbi:MAG: DUF1501 domain-containing protein [Planctomycetaceae bacterium]
MKPNPITRRTMLGASGAALLAGGSGRLMASLSATSSAVAVGHVTPRATAERVIFFWLGGGLSHLDTWDPKPQRPSQGEFDPIATSATGVWISEIFPRLASQMHHCALVRSLVGQYDQHLPATSHLQTGREPTAVVQHPGIGSICVRALGQSQEMPPYASISGRAPSSGWLGPRFAAEFIPSPENALNLSPPPPSRGRDGVGGRMRRGDAETRGRGDGDADAAAVSARYGDTTFGRGTLLARLLVERGTLFVHVYRGGFDTHANAFHTLRMHGDVMDRPLAALIEDLAQSGLLATTLVVVLSEFGRSPRVNSHAGRDHWSGCFSCLLAGGGISGGTVVGESDRDGYRPLSTPVQVGDLHATIFRALGITEPSNASSTGELPLTLNREFHPVMELFA